VSTYLSLGVVEHDPEGPDAILREAARVLRPGGTLLISVPYWNGVRRLLGPYIARSSARTAANGGQFYQYAFSRWEVRAFLGAHGFTVRSFHPYDPARLLRTARRALVRSSTPSAGQTPRERATRRSERRGLPVRALRALLYTPPSLRLLGHMILAVAERA
jgi:SAM-dependent methyltransferase